MFKLNMKKCSLCDGELVEFIDLGNQPMANKYPFEADFANEEFYPLKMCFCRTCKSSELDTFVSRDKMFVDYYYLSSVNGALVKHYENFAHTLGDAKFVVDAGSNDGISLKPLKEMGIKCLGVEPSVNVSQLANDAGFETMNAFLNADSVETIVRDYGKPDVVTGFSMFSHLKDPHQFIEDVKNLMTDDGKFVIEVEYLVSILKRMTFERFYLDHTFSFSVTALENLFQMHDMYLSDAEITAIHGGCIRVTAQKKGHGVANSRVQEIINDEANVLNEEALKEFGRDAVAAVNDLKEALRNYKKIGLTIAAYGCPARFGTITNFGDIGSDLIKFVVDDSYLKQTRFSPGKHIPIVPKSYLDSHPVDVLIFFAYESFEDIKKKLTHKAKYLFPIPVREV